MVNLNELQQAAFAECRLQKPIQVTVNAEVLLMMVVSAQRCLWFSEPEAQMMRTSAEQIRQIFASRDCRRTVELIGLFSDEAA